MTCILYREGKGTVEHGIVCESTACEIEHMEGLLAAGWSANPPGYTPPAAAESVEEDLAGIHQSAAGIHPVREAAKAAGIAGWDFKRIGTLEKMLGA